MAEKKIKFTAVQTHKLSVARANLEEVRAEISGEQGTDFAGEGKEHFDALTNAVAFTQDAHAAAGGPESTLDPVTVPKDDDDEKDEDE